MRICDWRAKMKEYEQTSLETAIADFPIVGIGASAGGLEALWSELLNSELEYYDKYLKYGKMKGWTRVVPISGEPVT